MKEDGWRVWKEEEQCTRTVDERCLGLNLRDIQETLAKRIDLTIYLCSMKQCQVYI